MTPIRTGTLAMTVAVMAMYGAATGRAADLPTLTVSVYGIAQEQYRKDLFAPFEAVCGCKIVLDAGNTAERLARLEAHKDDPVVDVAAIADYTALEAARKGLVEPIDTGALTNYGKLYDFAKDPIGGHMAVGYTLYASSIVYRSDKGKIASWKDMFAPEWKGRLALPNISTSQGPLTLFMLDGALGGASPDFTGAIDKVAANKHDIVTFYERSAQLNQLLQQEDVWISETGRFGWASIRKLNMPIAWAMPAEGQTGGINVLVLVKGSKHKELAMKLIDMWLSDDVQKALALDRVDSPANSKVEVPADVAEDMTVGPDMAKALKFIPPQDVLDHRDAWLAGWNAKIAN